MHYGDVDHGGGAHAPGDEQHEDRNSLILSSIERFGCHIPKCVAKSLEDNPLEGMEGKEYYCNINDNDNSRKHNQNPLMAGGSRRASMGRRLSWSSSSTGMSSNWANSSFATSPSTATPGGGGRRESAPDLNYITGMSEGSNSSLRTAEISNLYPLPMPSSNLHHRSALLLVDISGFTKLSTLLDVESLSKAINNYFESLLREVEIYDGDILKFAGDAFYAEWIGEDDEDLEDAITKATLCAASIVKKYSGYLARGLHHKTGKEETATLDVHCGVGVGDIAIIHVGNHESRREFLVLGDPIDQVSKAEGFATLGELAASPEAIRMLQNVCQISDEIDIESNGPQVLAFRDKQWFTQDDFTDDDLWMHPQPYRPAYVSPNTIEALQYQMSLYVHPTARKDEVMGVDHHSHRNIANAELRNVYTIFVTPSINPKLTGHVDEDANLFALLNDIMCVTNRVLDRFRGHLRQFIVDDKGVVLIATFGQRGATFPNMVTEKGLPATIAIFDALKIELDVNCHIGATIGRAYCGVVGGERRHEFAVLGPSVNLAARLMSSKNNPGILVDDAVRIMASKRFDFVSHPPVKAKGYPDLVPIFEPHSAIERQWNKIKDFVGRQKETEELVLIARDFIMRRRSMQYKPHLVLIQAHSGLGKSSLVMQVMEKVRRFGRVYSKKNIMVKKNVCKDGEERVPFSVFRQIILDLLNDYGGDDPTDYDDNASQGSESSLSFDGLDDDSTASSDRVQLERLRALCKDLNHTEEFADVIGENMFGLRTNHGMLKDLKPNDVMDFVADAFIKCTSGSDFVLLALDDVHWMDSLSWKVVQCLYERGANLMILCNSRPLASNNISIDPDFLQNLRSGGNAKSKSRFTEILLQPFSKSDVRDLLAASLECMPSSIDESLCNSMYEQSGGMPYFAQELVRNLIRNDLLENRQDGTAGLRKELSEDVQKFLYASINDLLLHRLDSLNSYARTLLQVCAVLGFEFTLSELLMVQCKGRRRTASQIKKIQDGLNTAVTERILMEVFRGGSNRKVANHSQNRRNDEHIATDERSYTFTHAIWRKCVLGTMLKERERDLHRIVASLLEGSGLEKVVEPISAFKIFRHWQACGNFAKASSIALKIAAYFETLNLHHQAVEVYIDAVNMWKESSDDVDTDLFSVPSWKLLNKLIPDELDCVGRLYLALAKSHVNIGEPKIAASLFQTCDTILSKAPASEYLKDRTIYFSVFSGLFIIIKGGHVTDPKNLYEQDLAIRFVEQARLHGDPIHITRALAMQSLLFGGLGKFDEALEAQHRVEELYDAETLSEGIVKAYASDRVAQNYGYSVLWYEVLGQHEESEKQINFILNELMPKMPEKNVHNSIMVILPVLWVLVDKGQARRAEETFRSLVYDKFYEFFGKDGSTTYFQYIYKPLNTLLRLAGDAQEGEKLEPELYADYTDWVLSSDVGTFKQFDVTSMCNLGRDPYALISEICWWLAVADDSNDKHRALLEKGMSQALKSKEATQGKPGFEYARRLGEKIFERFI